MGKWWSEGTPDFQTPFWECWECWDIPWWNSLKNMVRTTFLFKKNTGRSFVEARTEYCQTYLARERERASQTETGFCFTDFTEEIAQIDSNRSPMGQWTHMFSLFSWRAPPWRLLGSCLSGHIERHIHIQRYVETRLPICLENEKNVF